MTVDFYTPQAITGVWLTDLFKEPDGVDDEEAIVELFYGGSFLDVFHFFGEVPLGTDTAENSVTSGALTSSIWSFSSPSTNRTTSTPSPGS